MARTITILVALVCLAWLAAPAMAQQPMGDCDAWVGKINSEVGIRVDDASHNARLKVTEIAQLCKEGKTAEAEQAAKEAMATLGIKQ